MRQWVLSGSLTKRLGQRKEAAPAAGSLLSISDSPGKQGPSRVKNNELWVLRDLAVYIPVTLLVGHNTVAFN